MDSTLQTKVISYRRAMSMVKVMRSEGIITPEEYTVIDTILAEKYGLTSSTIFREMTG